MYVTLIEPKETPIPRALTLISDTLSCLRVEVAAVMRNEAAQEEPGN